MAGLLIDDPVKLSQAVKDGNIIPGDTVYLAGGIYTLDYDFKISGTPAAPITFKAYDVGEVIIRPASAYRGIYIGYGIHDLVLEDLIVDGTNVQTDCIKITSGALRIKLDGCELKNAPGNGVLVTGSTTSATITNCKVHDCGTTKDHHGIYVGNGIVKVDHNIVYNCSGHGVHAYGGSSTMEIYDNYIYDCVRVGIGCYSLYALVYNNVCRRNGANIRVRYGALSVEIYHNTLLDAIENNMDVRAVDSPLFTAKIYNNLMVGSPVGVHFEMGYPYPDKADDCVEFYNNFISGPEAAYRIPIDDDGGADAINLVNNILGDACTPVTDDTEDSYIPGTGNPAKGAGIAVASVTTDYGGNARANPPTIGAWE